MPLLSQPPTPSLFRHTPTPYYPSPSHPSHPLPSSSPSHSSPFPLTITPLPSLNPCHHTPPLPSPSHPSILSRPRHHHTSLPLTIIPIPSLSFTITSPSSPFTITSPSSPYTITPLSSPSPSHSSPPLPSLQAAPIRRRSVCGSTAQPMQSVPNSAPLMQKHSHTVRTCVKPPLTFIPLPSPHPSSSSLFPHHTPHSHPSPPHHTPHLTPSSLTTPITLIPPSPHPSPSPLPPPASHSHFCSQKGPHSHFHRAY